MRTGIKSDSRPVTSRLLLRYVRRKDTPLKWKLEVPKETRMIISRGAAPVHLLTRLFN